jgi:2-polyprenyl-3-methyl-5-hydroxy-6-metoxy-1,4-benzoquinol methylase
MTINTTYRSTEDEIMDDFSLEGEELRQALDKIAKINQLLGGNKVTLEGIKKLLKDKPKNQQYTIVDVGCGNGDMLRAVAKYGKRNNINLNLIGIDANQFTIDYAKKLSTAYNEITYRCEDIFHSEFETLQYDILLCTLTLHHFPDDKIVQLLETFKKNATIGTIINDLHRSKIAYRSFQLICFIFQLNTMSKQDGLTSILRGFKKEELNAYAEKLQFKNHTIRWKWAFRHQWIIKSSNH